MKVTFSKEYIYENSGCYSKERVNSLLTFSSNKTNIRELFNQLPIRDFCWFLVKKCELTAKQVQYFSLFCAKLVEKHYNNKYPNDSRILACNESTKLYLEGKILLEELEDKKYDAAYAAADAADAAYAAAYAAADAAAVADAAYAAYAAYADVAYRLAIWKYIEENLLK